MSRPERIGVKKPLQSKVSGWVHEYIDRHTAVPGVEAWMVIEDTFRMRIEAEERAEELALAVGASTVPPAQPKRYTDSESHEAYCWAAAAIETYFEKEPDVFMHTLSQVRGERKALTSQDWRGWKKKQRVPEKYLPTIYTVIAVTNGIDRARRLAGVYDAVKEE